MVTGDRHTANTFLQISPASVAPWPANRNSLMWEPPSPPPLQPGEYQIFVSPLTRTARSKPTPSWRMSSRAIMWRLWRRISLPSTVRSKASFWISSSMLGKLPGAHGTARYFLVCSCLVRLGTLLIVGGKKLIQSNRLGNLSFEMMYVEFGNARMTTLAICLFAAAWYFIHSEVVGEWGGFS